MALINCPECGKQISNKASQCIHCGFPLKHDNSDPSMQHTTIRSTRKANSIMPAFSICKTCGWHIPDGMGFCPKCANLINSTDHVPATAKKSRPPLDDVTVKALGIIFCLLLILCLVGSCSSRNTDISKIKFKSDLTCGWCGRVIRAGGRNIHATSSNGGLSIICDYCGHSNSILDR